MRICNFDTNFEVFCVFLVPIDYFNRIMCDNNTINSFTFAKTAKLIFNEAGKIKYIQISVKLTPKFLCKTNGKMDFLGARRAITQCRVITVRPIFFKMVLNRAQSLNEKSHEISARKNKK